MEKEYLIIIVALSVLAGVIIISLIAVCIARIVTNKNIKKKIKSFQYSSDDDMQTALSYVHYPAPEPYTPQEQMEEPWQQYHNTQHHQQHQPVGVAGRATAPGGGGATADETFDYIQDPYNPSHYHRSMPLDHQKVHKSSSYAPQSSYLPSKYVENKPRTRYSYGDVPRSKAQQQGQVPTQQMHERPRPRGREVQRHYQDVNKGNKLWYDYITEEPDYFTVDGIQWNRRQSKLYAGSRENASPSPTPHRAASLDHHQRDLKSPYHHHHHHQQRNLHQQAASRLSWM